MRIVDADILSYALYDESPAHIHAWRIIERGMLGEIELYLTYTTILEVYNVLFWFYRIRPLNRVLEKLKLVVESLKVVETSLTGLSISLEESIPLGDDFLIAAALSHRIPVIVSNDAHVAEKAPKYGLIIENPIPEETRRKLAEWKGEE